jgi:uncharacterized protein (UPF0335 family)
MSDSLNDIVSLIERLHKEYLLINRIIYKVKNQFRRQKQFQLLKGLKNTLSRELFTDDSLIIIFPNLNKFISRIEDINKQLTKLGQIIKEMLKLKLFTNYSVIILSILR